MDIGIGSLDLLSSGVVGIAVVFLTYAFLVAFGATTEELKQQQVEAGDDNLSELYIRLSPEAFFLVRLAGFIVPFALLFVFTGLILAVVVGVLGFFAPVLALNRLKAKRVRKIELQLVEGLELLGNSLKSGMTLPQATELLVKEFPAPISQEFSLVMAETRLGVDFTDALQNMAERLDSTIVQILASGVSITKRCGGDMTVIFSNIAQTIRERATIEGKLEAVTAQGRFQGMVLGLMPFALVIVLYFIDRQHVETLFKYQLGIWAFSSVIVMVILAQLWIRKLLAIDV